MTIQVATFQETSYILLLTAVEQAQTLSHDGIRKEIQSLLDTAEAKRTQEDIDGFYEAINTVKEKIRLALN